MGSVREILVVEDDPGFAQLMERVLARKARANVRVAPAGESALELLGLEGEGGGQRPQLDLIFVDLNLPGCDGLEVLRRLKAEGSPYREVPALMVSAAFEPTDIEAAERIGAAGVLHKDRRFVSNLREALHRWLSS